MKETKTKNCKSCGSVLTFSPKHENLYCNHCETVFEIDKKQEASFHDVLTASDSYEDKLFEKNNTVFNCENCGAEMILNSSEFAKCCPYCGSYNINKTRKNPGISPDNIIPFAIEKEQAALCYKNAMKKKVFAPREFKKKPPIEKIFGIYVPTLAYNANSETTYTGKIREEHTTIDSQGFRNTNYTYRKIAGNINVTHKNVLVESSSYMNQLEFESIGPFNYSKLFKYNDDFIRGYYVEYHSTPLDTCTNVAHTIMKNEISSQIRKKYQFQDVVELNLNTNFKNEIFTYYLFPTYRCEYTYKNKKYKAFINGQTGKVGGITPKSKMKISLLTIAIILLFAGFVALFMWLS